MNEFIAFIFSLILFIICSISAVVLLFLMVGDVYNRWVLGFLFILSFGLMGQIEKILNKYNKETKK
ncbi:unnamed protein product [marine sediment metagenome]|uniref:Uncharacterized protein n=1 Tax=marine sediment metagenome TaxID=412755 RepID=X0XED9_9ZZZZ